VKTIVKFSFLCLGIYIFVNALDDETWQHIKEIGQALLFVLGFIVLSYYSFILAIFQEGTKQIGKIIHGFQNDPNLFDSQNTKNVFSDKCNRTNERD